MKEWEDVHVEAKAGYRFHLEDLLKGTGLAKLVQSLQRNHKAWCLFYKRQRDHFVITNVPVSTDSVIVVNQGGRTYYAISAESLFQTDPDAFAAHARKLAGS